MSQIVETIKKLRELTGLGVIDCKKALQEAENNIDRALEILKEKGIKIAEKKEGKTTGEGLVGSYIHSNGKIGVLVEVTCESDFVARTEDFKELVKNICLQIAAASPAYIRKEEIPDDVIEEKKKIYKDIEEFYREKVLFCQNFVKDDSLTIEQYVKSKIAKLGENIKITRFTRYQIGE
ncbi:MAG: elongation factor Ts [Candidatus Omnitrophica bacterium]|nr:elongation factor Ts [Candidatus Omnitrophota bacterium]MCM8829324.1 elongation factor Ts [Candidatus Omnitrophota bacterium]